ncbi:hypothetical protein RvY_12879 [Ramazzottius varieornatus]|uniref:Uncharacterized protein n=1 Tax=Ramazzottius varieornatus TaxID=947166 RepID=A0A1D1VL04_RAMVA|nr:hypothetical protein RvY_12879 [Ramazzottius varieornatus]
MDVFKVLANQSSTMNELGTIQKPTTQAILVLVSTHEQVSQKSSQQTACSVTFMPTSTIRVLYGSKKRLIKIDPTFKDKNTY